VELALVVRTALGLFFVVHALAQAVLRFSGVLEYPPLTLGSAITIER
jgi:hypothetical protein